MTSEYVVFEDNNNYNQWAFQKRVQQSVEDSEQIFQKQYQDKPVTIYESKTRSRDNKRIVTIVKEGDGKTRSTQFYGPITDEEYSQLIDSSCSTFELTDWSHDPETGSMNNKSIREAQVLNRGIENGLDPTNEYRRPKLYLGERNNDFIDKKGNYYEIKSFGVSSNNRSLNQTLVDIRDNILKNHEAFQNDPNLKHPHYLMDVEKLTLEETIFVHKNITKELSPIINELTIDFID